MCYGRVYVITNLINGKQYVGQTTKTIQQRWKSHLQTINRKCHDNMIIYTAIRKYGINNFNIHQVVECLDKYDLDYSERLVITYFNTLSPYGYNLSKGGGGGNQRTKPHTLEEIRHVADAKRKVRYYLTPEGREFAVTHLPEFCRENSLSYCCMGLVASGDQPIHKGWVRLDQEIHKLPIDLKKSKLKKRWSKLTEDQVIDILNKRKEGLTIKMIHSFYPNMCRSTLEYICKRKLWKGINFV